MKKLLVIFLLTFAVIVGFSGSVSAAPVHGQGSLINVAPHITFAPNIVFAPIINSPGTKANINSPGAILGNNVISKTGGDTFNTINSRVSKSTKNIGRNINTIGNTVF